MARRDDDRPTEHTPKGAEVPVPRRREFFSNLRKVAKSAKPLVSRPKRDG
jgi:hypothetical protein